LVFLGVPKCFLLHKWASSPNWICGVGHLPDNRWLKANSFKKAVSRFKDRAGEEGASTDF
jgi:hypothetical protein